MSAPVLCVLPLQPTFLSPVLESWLLYSFPDIQHMSLGRPRPWKLLCDSDCCLLQQNLAMLWTAVPRGWVSGPVRCRPEQPGLLQRVCVGKAMVPEHTSCLESFTVPIVLQGKSEICPMSLRCLLC